ncbi:NAD-dependent epimerase/dehydratase family protein [Arthrobacter sp. NPDC058130]|uniref:NAD-dependent epimerase/dehydratase family protein n=1 Tax=Arthrobacter sp. NPDC058130 TaxID=3346353 RepID=UPI0036E82C7F
MNLNSSQNTCRSDVKASAFSGVLASRSTRVLLIGATGFIGNRILRALQARNDVLISIVARRPTDFISAPLPKIFIGDVSDPESLGPAVKNADVVINAASYVGNEPKMAHYVNHRGALSVIEACRKSNVQRIVHISSTAVYGSGPHRATSPWEATFRPESEVSRSRALGDAAMLAAGGIVIRPNLVYGPGDRWFIPGAVRMFTTLGTNLENGRALLSTIDVADLGRLVAALAVTASHVSGAFHAANPKPIALAQLLATIDRHIAPLMARGNSRIEEAIRTLEPAGFSPHQIKMLGLDHHYQSHELWDMACLPSTSFEVSPEAMLWYRSRVASTRPS